MQNLVRTSIKAAWRAEINALSLGVAKSLSRRARACPTNTEYHVFVGNFVGNFVENGRKPTKFSTKFSTKFWENGFLGQALAKLGFFISTSGSRQGQRLGVVPTRR